MEASNLVSHAQYGPLNGLKQNLLDLQNTRHKSLVSKKLSHNSTHNTINRKQRRISLPTETYYKCRNRSPSVGACGYWFEFCLGLH